MLLPEITLTVGLYDRPRRDDAGDAIGRVVDSTWEGMRHHQIGSGQAWYYRNDRLLVLWELELWDRYRTSTRPDEDPAYTAIWRAFEHDLLTRFPDTKSLATPSWEPDVEPAVWQGFLTMLGYRSATPMAYSKTVGTLRP